MRNKIAILWGCVFWAVPVWAGPREVNLALDEAMLMLEHRAVSGAPVSPVDAAARGAADWQASLDQARQEAEALLAENVRLTGLRERAAGNVATLRARVYRAQQDNDRLRRRIAQARRRVADREQENTLRVAAAAAEADLARERAALSGAKTQQRLAEKRVQLLQLKLRDAELDRKAALAAQQARVDGTVAPLQAALRVAKARRDEMEPDLVRFRARHEELLRSVGPALEESRARSLDIARLKEDVARRTEARDAAARALKETVQAREKATTDPVRKKIADIEARRAALRQQIDALAAREKSIAVELTRIPEGSPEDMEAHVREMEERNKQMEQTLGDLRENIAVLDYRINMLTRYRDRNVAPLR